MRDKAEILEEALRSALDALQDESIEVNDRLWEAESILEEALEEA